MYLNNILVYLKTKKEHVQHVTKVLQTLNKIKLKVKSEKSVFHIQKVSFLDFIIIIKGI